MNSVQQRQYICSVLSSYPQQLQHSEQTCTWARDVLLNGHTCYDETAKYLLAPLQKRYQFISPREALLKHIFEKAFFHDPEPLILQAQQLSPNQKPFYPTWKKVCWIQIPSAVFSLCKTTAFKIALFIGDVVFLSLFMDVFYRNLNLLVFQRIDSFLFSSYAATHWRDFLCIPFLVFPIIKFCGPFINARSKAIHRIRLIADSNAQERLLICKEKAYAVWKQTTEALLRNNDLAFSRAVS